MKLITKVIAILIACLAIINIPALADDKDYFDTKPTTNNGKKWRIAYYEGGEYLNYQQVFSATVRGLIKLGWIDAIDIPTQQGEQTKDLWNWLAENTKSEYIEFVKNAHYTANWEDDLRKNMVADIMTRIKEKNDIDLLIAMGTWAGKDLANNKNITPTIVLSTSDPISAGIIRSVEDSGYEYIHAHVDPYRWERQLRLFHEIIGFKKLGIAYENTVNGRSYAAIDVVEKAAKERDFEVIRCYTKSDISDIQEAEESVKKCFRELANTSEAIYVTEQGGVNNRSIPELVKIVNKKNIPTFAQYGSEMVKYGFLISTSTAGFKYVGEFHAETVAKVFNGAKPNQLDQLFEEPPKIAINLKTSEIIGFDPPLIILGAADEIFRKIAVPQ